MRHLATTILALLLSAGTAMAGDFIDRRKLDPARFAQVAALIAEEMGPGGRFEFVLPAERARVDTNLDHMRSLLAGKQSLADLDEEEKVALINAQEQVNAILTRRDGERLICERRALVGSHRRESVCETYAERMQRSRGSRDRNNELNRRIQICDDSGKCVSG